MSDHVHDEAASRTGRSSAHSVDEVTERNVRAIAALDRAAKTKLSLSHRVVIGVTTFCGTVTFAAFNVVLMAAWIVINTLPGFAHPDPFPFVFLTLLLSIEAIFLSIFILISQNEEQRLADRRNALDLQINLLAEQESTRLLRMLERIARKLDVRIDDDPAITVLEQSTRPEKVAEQIDRAMQSSR